MPSTTIQTPSGESQRRNLKIDVVFEYHIARRKSVLGMGLQVEVACSVEVAVGDGFHDVVLHNAVAGLEVGDGAGDFRLWHLATGLEGILWPG